MKITLFSVFQVGVNVRAPFHRQLLLQFHRKQGVGVFILDTLFQILQQLLLFVFRHIHFQAGVVLQFTVVLEIVPLVLKELDDGVLGEVELCRQSLDGLFIRVQAHILDEALKDPQGFHRNFGSWPGLLPVFLIGLCRGGHRGLPWGQPGACLGLGLRLRRRRWRLLLLLLLRLLLLQKTNKHESDPLGALQ